MTIGAKKQDSFTVDEVIEKILPKLEKGKYQLDVGPDGTVKVSIVSNRWIQREDLEQ